MKTIKLTRTGDYRVQVTTSQHSEIGQSISIGARLPIAYYKEGNQLFVEGHLYVTADRITSHATSGDIPTARLHDLEVPDSVVLVRIAGQDFAI